MKWNELRSLARSKFIRLPRTATRADYVSELARIYRGELQAATIANRQRQHQQAEAEYQRRIASAEHQQNLTGAHRYISETLVPKSDYEIRVIFYIPDQKSMTGSKNPQLRIWSHNSYRAKLDASDAQWFNNHIRMLSNSEAQIAVNMLSSDPNFVNQYAAVSSSLSNMEITSVTKQTGGAGKPLFETVFHGIPTTAKKPAKKKAQPAKTRRRSERLPAPQNVTRPIWWHKSYHFDSIDSPYTTTKFDREHRAFRPDYKSQYVRDNYRANACLYTAIIDAVYDCFAADYEREKANLKRILPTYEYLYEMIHGHQPADNADWGLTLQQLYDKVLIEWGLGLRIIDNFGNKLCPDITWPADHKRTFQKHLSPRIITVIRHDDHIYPVTASSKQLAQRLGPDYKERKIENVSTTYRMPKKTKAVQRFAANYDQLIDIITADDDVPAPVEPIAPQPDATIADQQAQDRFIDNEANEPIPDLAEAANIPDQDEPQPRKQVRIAANNVEHLVLSLIDNNLIPSIHTSSNKEILGAYFKTNNADYAIIKYDGGAAGRLAFENDNHFNNFAHAKENFETKLITPLFRSVYSNSVAKAINTYSRPPMVGRIEKAIPNAPTASLDICRAYTSYLRQITRIPIFTKFDEFQHATPQKIAALSAETYDLSFFVIKVHYSKDEPKADRILVANSYEMVSGKLLRHLPRSKYDIKYMLAPGKIIDFPIVQALNEILSNNDLTAQDKKNIPNILTGMLLKRKNHKTMAAIFRSFAYAREQFPAVHPLEKLDQAEYNTTADIRDKNNRRRETPQYYLGSDHKSVQLTDGFYFIGLLIYDISRISLYQLYKSIENIPTLKPFAVRTDAVYFQSTDKASIADLQQRYKSANPQKMMNPQAKTWDNMGKYKFENSKPPGQEIDRRSNDDELADHIIKPNPPNIIVPADEYDNQEFIDIFNKNNRTMVKADYAGCGKTEAFFRYMSYLSENNQQPNPIIVAPFNNLRLSLQTRGQQMPAITVNHLLGIGIKDEHNRQPIDLSNYTHMLIDEINLLNMASIGRLVTMLAKYPDLHVIATGDEYQNPPVGDGFHPSYYANAIDQLFPTQIRLRINKRINDETQKQTYYRLMDDLKALADNAKSADILAVLKKHLPAECFVDSFENMFADNVVNVCYTHATVDRVNNYFHQFRPNPSPQPGDEYICRTHTTFQQNRQRRAFYVNMPYTIVSRGPTHTTLQIPASKFMNRAGVLEDLPPANAKLSNKTFEENFALPYARTCHSLQGTTAGDRANIFDINFHFITKYWVIPAISRQTSLNLRFFISPLAQSETVSAKYLQRKINSYKKQDERAYRLAAAPASPLPPPKPSSTKMRPTPAAIAEAKKRMYRPITPSRHHARWLAIGQRRSLCSRVRRLQTRQLPRLLNEFPPPYNPNPYAGSYVETFYRTPDPTWADFHIHAELDQKTRRPTSVAIISDYDGDDEELALDWLYLRRRGNVPSFHSYLQDPYAPRDRKPKPAPTIAAPPDDQTFITVKQFRQMIDESPYCTHCYTPLTINPRKHVSRDPRQLTLDRIDNNLPHTADNVVLACLDCNRRRVSFA
ncbi:MAG: AAA family ATPase [Castellaniella sp.]